MEDLFNALALLANFILVPGLTYTSQLALGALGVTLIYGVLRFAHFAHGDLMSLGTVFAILLTWWFQSLGIGLGVFPTAFLALPPAIIATAAVSLTIDRLVYRHYREQKAKPIIFLMVSIGVMFILGGVVRVVIGTGGQSFADGARFIISARDFREATGLKEAIRQSQAITIVIAFALMAWLFWFLHRTRLGKAMRAYQASTPN